MGAGHLPTVLNLTARFSQLVAEDDFGADPLTPSMHWATIVLLWLRKVQQCCLAAGDSIQTTAASREAKIARKAVGFWEKAQRQHAESS